MWFAGMASSFSLRQVRFIRTRRFKQVILPEVTSGQVKRNEVAPNKDSPRRNPRDMLSNKKLTKQNPASELHFEVSDMKPEDVKPVTQKKLLGRHVAENLRRSKREAGKGGSSWNEHNSIKCPDLSRLGHVELSKLLRKQVIYADENLVVLNKPYGLVAHDGDDVNLSLRSCLPILSKMIYGLDSKIPLFICNRLDKGTTGITVCATNKDVAYNIMDMFRKQKIRRKYWAITVGEPNPGKGIIDIPMSLHHVTATRKGTVHSRMTLAPDQKIEYETGELVNVRPRKPLVAVTHYQTLDTNGGLAFLELQPFTTVKHQLRVHAAEGISCCILGDHKYSRTDDLRPQTLSQKIMYKYKMDQKKSRDMPMHLHLREIIIPGILDNSKSPNLLISAKFPYHMFHTTKLFKLKPGHVTDFKYPARLKARKPTVAHKNPNIEELYVDPFADPKPSETLDKPQRDDCYAVYKPRVQVKFQYQGMKNHASQ